MKKLVQGVHRNDWAQTLTSGPLLDAGLGSDGCFLRSFKNTQPNVIQPPLKDNYVVLHLGGPKRVRRTGHGPALVADLHPDAISVVPARTGYSWTTEGPIEYAHIYVPPERLAWAAESIFDRDGAQVELKSEVGERDPVLTAIFQTLIDAAQRGPGDGLFTEVMTEAFLGQLIRKHANLADGVRQRQHALAPKKLKDVTEYIAHHLDEELTLDALASLARLSRYHFCRAFTRATGETPHAYVMERRLDRAKTMLRETTLSVSEIARRCGFAGAPHFSNRLFERDGVRPTTYRRSR